MSADSDIGEAWSSFGVELYDDLGAPLLGFFETHGDSIMLVGFSICWFWSIAPMLRTGKTDGKSAGFDLICIIAYLAGILQYRAVVGADWQATTTGALFIFNLALATLDLTVLISVRSANRTASGRKFHEATRRGSR